MREIYFAGGCFWGVERLFSSIEGVTETECGYANGKTDSPTYEAVCRGDTDHRETVRVVYDEKALSLERLLFAFFSVVDPAQQNRQGHDVGTQYQTGIYYVDGDSEKTVSRIADIERTAGEFYVEILPLKRFFPAEEYHQKYLQKNPQGYCHLAADEIHTAAKTEIDPRDYVRPAKVINASRLSS